MKKTFPAILLLLFISASVPAQEFSTRQAGGDGQKTDSIRKGRNFEIGGKASTELYFFQILSNKKEDSLDFSDAAYVMEYEIEPVWMTSLEAYVRWKSFALSAGYKTNRFMGSGGTIEEGGKVITDLTDSEIVSQIIQLGLGIANLSTSFRSVQFDFGRADVLDYATDRRVDSGQMELRITDFEILYDFYPMGKDFPLKISPGYKYVHYGVPRIVYRFEDAIKGETDAWVYSGETKPQVVETTAHMGGAVFDISPKIRNSRLGVLCALGMFIGPSKTSFVLNGSEKEQILFTFVGRLRTGVSAELFDSAMKGKVLLEYDLDMIDTRSGESNIKINDKYSESSVKYVFGSTDFYHGLSLTLDISY